MTPDNSGKKCEARVEIPVKEYPDYNFTGILIGRPSLFDHIYALLSL
jgi:hypothetical protein